MIQNDIHPGEVEPDIKIFAHTQFLPYANRIQTGDDYSFSIIIINTGASP
jgi:hypothetical protein